jgi:hypothetical protein
MEEDGDVVSRRATKAHKVPRTGAKPMVEDGAAKKRTVERAVSVLWSSAKHTEDRLWSLFFRRNGKKLTQISGMLK